MNKYNIDLINLYLDRVPRADGGRTEVLSDKKHFLISFKTLISQIFIEAVAQRCSVQKVFLEISQNS